MRAYKRFEHNKKLGNKHFENSLNSEIEELRYLIAGAKKNKSWLGKVLTH